MTTPEISKVIKLIIVNSLLVSISSGIIGSFAFFSIRKKRMAEATIITSNPNKIKLKPFSISCKKTIKANKKMTKQVVPFRSKVESLLVFVSFKKKITSKKAKIPNGTLI